MSLYYWISLPVVGHCIDESPVALSPCPSYYPRWFRCMQRAADCGAAGCRHRHTSRAPDCVAVSVYQKRIIIESDRPFRKLDLPS